MAGTYNPWLVILSVVVAVVASFVALEAAGRVTAARRLRWLWLGGAAVCLGSGIWSMHFVGMLAFRLPIPVAYDLPTTVASLMLPIAVEGVALHAACRASLGTRHMLLAGLAAGFGIVGMHYTGMAAMKMQPPILYAPVWVGASVVIAVAASTLGIWTALRLRMETLLWAIGKKAGSALVTGGGIAGMHYAGMAAATFAPGAVCTAGPQAVYPEGLAGTIAAFSLAFQALALCVSAAHAYAADRISRRSRGRLMEAQESERRRMSRELHDRVGQNLTALDINLDILRERVRGDDAIRARIDDSIGLVATTADAIDNVMSELRPAMLDDHGLAAALQWYAGEFSARTGIEVEVSGDAPGPRPAPGAEIALFRIAQEALTNVARHSRATRAQIVVERAGDRCTLVVSDNGIGFDRDGAGETRGLAIMTERAQAMGGEVGLRSRRGEGTRVTASLPC